jgi:N,N-dimethylformamidase beta subunit-like protein
MEQPTQGITGGSSLICTSHASGARRVWILLLFCCACFAFWGAVQPSSLNKIQRENLQPGTTIWQLTNPADNREIEGYASLTSVRVGGDIDLFVNTKDTSYTYTIFRMGWYGGKGGRKVMGPQSRVGVQQPMPSTSDPVNTLVECNWNSPIHVHIPSSWVSGIYLVKLHGKNSGKESYITFTVRDSRRADLVFKQSVITYQAYNPWPGLTPLGGNDGYSLYNQDTNGVQVPHVSFSRPYGSYPATDPFYTDPMYYSSQFARHGVGAGDFLRHAGPAAMEYLMVRWLEREGYDVTYITDVDAHEEVGRLLRGKGLLCVGHDEYWSEAMRANAVQARDAGVSLAFFSGNYVYWAVDLHPDSNGRPNRTITLVDPSKTCTFTCMGKPEQSLAGGNWVGSVPTNGDIFINARTQANDAPLDHWIFANTGLQVGDVIPGLIGIEYNGIDPSVATPAGLQTLIHSQAPRFEDGLVTANGGFRLPNNFNGDFNTWYEQAEAFVNGGGTLSTHCDKNSIPPLNIVPPDGFCSNAWPVFLAYGGRSDWAMTIYQVSSGAWVFNAATNQWTWGLDDYFTGLNTSDGANNGPAFRIQCGYPWFHPGLVSCRDSRIEQITRNVLNKFINP